MEKLKTWIAKNCDTKRSFAQAVGLSDAGLHGILHGRNLPNVRTAVKIEDATNGEVTTRDW